MRITNLSLKNIGVFKDKKIEFQPCPQKNKAEIHIFTNNGSGKSTILKGVAAAFEGTVPNKENDKEVVTTTDTNKISKFLRKKDETCGASVFVDDNGEISCIEYSGSMRWKSFAYYEYGQVFLI